jgi:type IX secretion system PorP/SprF family membrane protein
MNILQPTNQPTNQPITNQPINQSTKSSMRYSPILMAILLWQMTAGCGLAQQLPQYSLYMLNPYGYNPAAAGVENTLVVTGVYRQQWADLSGAPSNRTVNVQMPLSIIRSGIGLRFETDAIGAHNITQAVASYNYQLELGTRTLLALGVGAGYLQYSLDGAKLRAPQGTYVEPTGVFLHNDPLLPEGTAAAGTPVFEAGVYLQLQNFEVNLAAQPVFAPALQAGRNGFRLRPVQHYITSVAAQFDLGDNLTMRPSVLLRTDLTATQTELSTIFRWRENIFGGASFRGLSSSVNDALVAIAGFKINEKTTLAYAFDVPLSPLRAVNRGSHELLLRFSLNRPVGAGKLPPIIYNPRFL